MKKRLLKKCSYAVLAALLALAVVPASASGQGLQKGQSQGGRLEGTWLADVTVTICATGAPIRTVQSLSTYLRGGAALETTSATFLRSPGHGVWRHVGGQSYTTTFTVFRFGFNPGDSANPFPFVGTLRVTKTIELGADGDEYTATTASEIFDANGNLIGTGCATDVARRYE